MSPPLPPTDGPDAPLDTTMPPAWRSATVTQRTDWAPGLFSLVLDGAAPPFVPGQFASLGRMGHDGWVQRSYSLASAPDAAPEVFLVEVPGGRLTPALDALQIGDHLAIGPRAAGHFTLHRVPDATVLWLVATGTGLAPYLSMLRAGVTGRFGRVIVVHGVRESAHLAYAAELDAMPGVQRIGVVSREAGGTLVGRITERIADGSLEDAAGAALAAGQGQVLLCGNPAMVAEVQTLLADRGMLRNRPSAPGQVTAERYW